MNTLAALRSMFLCAAVFVPAVATTQCIDPYIRRDSEKPAPTEVDKGFDAAARKHKVELRDLFFTRGLPALEVMRFSTPAHELVPLILREYYPSATAVLFYSYHSESLAAWLVTSHGIVAHHLKAVPPSTLANVISHLRQSIGVESLSQARSPVPRGVRVRHPATVEKFNCQQAQADATSLFLPNGMTEKLKEVRHLIVVPVLGLGTIPFALLQLSTSGEFLIDRMSVSVAPSLFDLTQVLPPEQMVGRDPVRFTFGPSVIVGNPDFSSDPDWSFPPLPGAAREAKAVAKTVGTEALTGPDASKARVLKMVGAADFLYFATHGVSDPENPVAGSFLALAGASKDDIRWTVKEIQSLHLVASLAVLSACQTGLGKSHDAGIIGLARAFQIAGVPRVVMSLWNVDDDATSQMMQDFVSELKSCENEACIPSEALRSAILHFKKLHPEPRLWAPFVLFGTPR